MFNIELYRPDRGFVFGISFWDYDSVLEDENFTPSHVYGMTVYIGWFAIAFTINVGKR